MNSRLVEITVADISNASSDASRASDSSRASVAKPGAQELSCVTCSEMKALEKAADAAGLSYYQMMENAGTLSADLILAELSKADWLPSYDVVFDLKPQVLVFCGKGNNGGDGFVVARKLSEKGFPVSVIFVEGPPTTPDAIENEQKLPKSVDWISVQAFLETRLDAFPGPFSGIIVDAIYGTGFHGELQSKPAKAIEWINHFGKMVVSLDLPSGLSGDMCINDPVPPLCVNADHTIVFHRLKPVHLCISAQPFLGKITLADIGINEALG